MRLTGYREGFVQQYIPKMVQRSLNPGQDDIIRAGPARGEQGQKRMEND